MALARTHRRRRPAFPCARASASGPSLGRAHRRSPRRRAWRERTGCAAAPASQRARGPACPQSHGRSRTGIRGLEADSATRHGVAVRGGGAHLAEEVLSPPLGLGTAPFLPPGPRVGEASLLGRACALARLLQPLALIIAAAAAGAGAGGGGERGRRQGRGEGERPVRHAPPCLRVLGRAPRLRRRLLAGAERRA